MFLATDIHYVLTSSILGFILGLLVGVTGGYALWGKR